MRFYKQMVYLMSTSRICLTLTCYATVGAALGVALVEAASTDHHEVDDTTFNHFWWVGAIVGGTIGLISPVVFRFYQAMCGLDLDEIAENLEAQAAEPDEAPVIIGQPVEMAVIPIAQAQEEEAANPPAQPLRR